MFGEGITQGRPVSSKCHGAPPALHANHREVHVEPPLFAEQQGQLAQGQPVADRQRVQAHERREGGVEDVAFDRDAAQGIGPVEDHHASALAGAGLEHVQHGVHERVVARAHVLHVEDDRVEAREHLGGGDPGAAVEAVAREAGARVAAVAHLHEVLRVRPDPVLGPEEGAQTKARRAREGDRRVLEASRDRGRIGHEPEPQAAQHRRPAEELVETGPDRSRARGRLHSTNLRVKLPDADLSAVFCDGAADRAPLDRSPEDLGRAGDVDREAQGVPCRGRRPSGACSSRPPRPAWTRCRRAACPRSASRTLTVSAWSRLGHGALPEALEGGAGPGLAFGGEQEGQLAEALGQSDELGGITPRVGTPFPAPAVRKASA